ncbi:hypothetical protein LD85_0975 [Saccharolobus islandicus L.D.8.5]|uniref:Tc1-like transposase DDE domain-containing protein n=1 Tax=Saccharolobus islandicus (strain L.D.8.5 / Lassen \|nr:hypothetical protein LD85_0975 [Sulfolobus islandicus L.D.8.5]
MRRLPILYLGRVVKDEKIVIIMQNARIHGNEVREFLEENNVEFIYLPPYSPDKSPPEDLGQCSRKSFTQKCARTSRP